jgi:hypothetical protein
LLLINTLGKWYDFYPTDGLFEAFNQLLVDGEGSTTTSSFFLSINSSVDKKGSSGEEMDIPYTIKKALFFKDDRPKFDREGHLIDREGFRINGEGKRIQQTGSGFRRKKFTKRRTTKKRKTRFLR